MPGRIPQDFINDLIDRSDIVEIIGSRIQIKKAGREFKACCPFHGEKTPSFTVSPEKGFYHCFGCGAHGTVVGFLMEHDQLEFVEAVEELASLNGVDVPRETGSGSAPTTPAAPLHELLEQAAQLYRAELRDHPAAIEYLKARGLDGNTTAHFQIGYAPAGWDFLMRRFGSSNEGRDQLLKVGLAIRNEEGRIYDRFRDRIMFPIRDSRGRTVGFGGRVMDKSEPKYLNSPETPVFHKGRELYGLFDARRANRNLNRLVVVEGYMDVVALAHHGISNSVATLGTATTPDHLQRLFRASNEIVFCFDGDRAGREAAWRALHVTLPELREGRQVRFLFLADGQDPDSVVSNDGADEFNRLLEKSLPLSDYLLEHLKLETDLGSMDGQAHLAELAKPLLNKIPAGVYRELLLDRLATEVGLSAERLALLLSDASARSEQSTEPAARQPRRDSHGRPGPIRQAVKLVLHRPAAASKVVVPTGFDQLQDPGLQLLRELLASAASNPDIMAARLAESFSDHPDGGRHLHTLLTQEHPLDIDSDWGAELQAALDKIAREDLERRFGELANKAHQGLSDTEKDEFRRLQKQLAGPNTDPA